MPKYDYKCQLCSLVFELEHEMAETMSEEPCLVETCTGLLRKVFSATPGHFKGQGWGKTYRVHKGKNNG